MRFIRVACCQDCPYHRKGICTKRGQRTPRSNREPPEWCTLDRAAPRRWLRGVGLMLPEDDGTPIAGLPTIAIW